MTNLLNKLLILSFLAVFATYNLTIQISVMPITIVVAICGFLEYFNNKKYNFYAFIAYLFISYQYPQFIYFLPIMFYDFIFTTKQNFIFLSFIPLLLNLEYLTFNSFMVLIIVSILEVVLKRRSDQINLAQSSFIKQRDSLREQSIELESKIISLSENQNDEINIATLNERNRIAREIHDNVGHLLSSSILQIAAIMATTKDESTKESLEIVKNTLNDGMDSIRNSVHDLRDNSIDLYVNLKSILDDFSFCETNFNYELSSNINIIAKYAIISIVKESLSNVIKHSNATELSISLYEHPQLVQLIILDNGTKKSEDFSNGMGIESIRQRVIALNGILTIDNSNGFKIFISFNKKEIL